MHDVIKSRVVSNVCVSAYGFLCNSAQTILELQFQMCELQTIGEDSFLITFQEALRRNPGPLMKGKLRFLPCLLGHELRHNMYFHKLNVLTQKESRLSMSWRLEVHSHSGGRLGLSTASGVGVKSAPCSFQ